MGLWKELLEVARKVGYQFGWESDQLRDFWDEHRGVLGMYSPEIGKELKVYDFLLQIQSAIYRV